MITIKLTGGKRAQIFFVKQATPCLTYELVIGGIADRIMNPTKKIRELIRKEFDNFSYSAKPEIVNYVLEVHHGLLQGISEEIIQNYENRMKQTVLLLVNK